MCCRNGPRRQPLCVTLGEYAYKKYQERKQSQQQLQLEGASSGTSSSSTGPRALEHPANEKAGLPPSYDDVVDSRPLEKGDLKHVGEDGASDSETDGETEAAVAKWRADCAGQGERERPVLSREQQKRAEKAIRKAERAARRADRAAMGL